MFFAYGLAWGNWWARLPAFKEQVHASQEQMGIILAGNHIGNLLVLPLAGPLARSVGLKTMAAGGGVAFAGLLAAGATARTVPAAFAGQCAAGAASVAFNVAINAQGAVVEAAGRRPCLSGMHAAFSLGTLAGTAVGAAIAHADVGLPEHLGVLAGVVAVASLAAGRLLLAGAAQAHRSNRPSGALWLLGAMAAISAVAEGAFNEWPGIYYREVLHTSLPLASAAGLPFQCAMFLGRAIGDPLRRTLSPPRLLGGGSALTAAGLGAALAINSAASMAMGTTAAGLGLAGFSPVLTSTAAALYPQYSVSAVACMGGFSHLGFLLGPPFIGLTAKQAGLRLAFCSLVAAGLVTLALAPKLAQTLAREPGRAHADGSGSQSEGTAATTASEASSVGERSEPC